MRPLFILLVLGCTLSVPACSGTSPAPKAAARPRAAAAAKPSVVATPTANTTPKAETAADEEEDAKYSYQSGGRRDPFLTLVSRESGKPAARAVVSAVPKRGEGVAGLLVSDITVRGVVQMDNRLVALVQGKDGRTYNVHQTDKLADGTVKAVTPEGLVITQSVNDSPSPAKQREVRKLLRSLEEAKQ
jgi:Tfp pilus assembly protein PilP